MPRLLIHVEGETEESFVNEILADHLYANGGFEVVSARLVGNARLRGKRGGIRAWSTVKKDILNHLKADTGCLATTMVDYYGLPQTGEKAWPGRAEAGRLTFRAEKIGMYRRGAVCSWPCRGRSAASMKPVALFRLS